MQLTRTPSSLPRSARHLVKAATAALTELPMVKLFVRLASAGSGDRDQRAVALLEERPRGARKPHMREEF